MELENNKSWNAIVTIIRILVARRTSWCSGLCFALEEERVIGRAKRLVALVLKGDAKELNGVLGAEYSQP